jgi:hypothetical protein
MEFESTEYKIYFVIGSTLVWSSLCVLVESLFSFKYLSPKVEHDTKNRFIAIIHGLLSCIMSGYTVFYDRTGWLDGVTDAQHLTMLISMGYFIYDTLACAYGGNCDRSLVIHHAMCIFGYMMSEYYDNASLPMAGVFYGELSNSWMHYRALLRIFGKKNTRLYEVFDLTYLSVYIISRGVFVSHLLYQNGLNTGIPFFTRFTCFGLWVQSLIFMKEMVGILKRKVSQAKERSKKDVSLFWITENPELKSCAYMNREVKEKVF